MSPEAQRIAIAEACGWTEGYPTSGNGELHWRNEKKWKKLSMGEFPRWLPTYLSDLNSIHEAEKTLKPNEKVKFRVRLWALMREPDDSIHATASQRAEAFLRTLNLWDDSK